VVDGKLLALTIKWQWSIWNLAKPKKNLIVEFGNPGNKLKSGEN